MINLNKLYSNHLNKNTFVDLFSGIGGFRLAMESFGARNVFSSDWDLNCQEIYLDNFNERPFGDITSIDASEIPVHDILCAGFPCQAFSISGKQLGFEDTRGTLFFDIARIAKYRLPKLLILENVKNFIKHDNGKTLEVVINTLNQIGYDIYYDVLNSSFFDVPQKRERIYILGFRKDLGVKKFQFPKGSNSTVKLIDFCVTNQNVNKYEIKRKDVFFKDSITIAKDIFGNYPQKPIRIGSVNKGGQGERIYHELGHAITLSAYGGGVGAKTGLYNISNKIRKLTPRECARISGFPDDFNLHSSDSVNYKVFGNTVVVNVIQYIIKEIIDNNYL